MRTFGNAYFLLALILCCDLLVGQNKEPYTASYIMEWGNKDTIGIETFTLYKNQIYGKAVHGFPENYVRHFDIKYDTVNGSIRELNFLYNDVANTSLSIDSKTGFLPYRFYAKLNDGLLDFKSLQKGSKENDSGLTRIVHQTDGYHFNGDWIPIIAQFEWLVSWFLEQDKEKIGGLKFINAYVGLYDLQLERINKKHIRFWSNISESIELYLNDDGRIENIDGIGSVWNLNIHRVDPVDIEHYTDRFKDRPTIGDPSPYETISATIAGAAIEIDYGRPSIRGRKIFGNIIPYGEIWRTGAGAATTISFDKDIVFGDQKVKAGKYNVYSLPTEDTFTLILNSNLDAWGSVHLPEFDVARVSMKLSKTSKKSDKFTIEVIEMGKKGMLRLSWENTISEISFTLNN
ncbi:DUF2911 domain-containing protein [Maribacter algicola]|uniref:DUF2911 domain-containing protein n=1 Tax=Meishania litoralis TaxID=3434685 RepID=A0ACC7LND7_9FLAO